MYELARNYKERGMTAYSELQQAELEAQKHGYTAVRHQREVGAGYFDLVIMAITGTETESFSLKSSLEFEAALNRK